MNRLGAGSKKLYTLTTWLVPIMPLAIALVSWCSGLDGTEVWLQKRPNISAFLERIKDISFWLYAFLWPLFIWAILYKRCGDPWLVEQLQFILDRYQAGAFNTDKFPTGVPQDHNRVTLFCRQKGFFIRHWSAKRLWRWGEHNPLSDFLVPVLRSGHMSKKSQVAFYISDDSDKTEGVAGRAWASDQVIFEEKLPKIETLTSEPRQKVYARRTGCDLQMIKERVARGAPMPRSIVAIPVRRFGKLWGVIVLDSRYPEGVNVAAPENYKLTLALIERLLERAS